MTATPRTELTIEALRREIDTIDRQIQSLLERRTDIVGTLSGLKKSSDAALPSSAMRPGREAQIIRQVVARHKGRLPTTVLTGLWRGIVSAFLRLQYPFTVHVAADLDGFSFWDMARIHYGPGTPLEAGTDAASVIARVAQDEFAVAVVPAPDAASRWWTALPPARAGIPQVVARLPLVQTASTHRAAFVIARADREPSGDDITLLRLAIPSAALFTCPPDAEIIAEHRDGAHVAYLLAVKGYLAPEALGAAPWNDFSRHVGATLDIIGGYATPIRLKDDAL